MLLIIIIMLQKQVQLLIRENQLIKQQIRSSNAACQFTKSHLGSMLIRLFPNLNYVSQDIDFTSMLNIYEKAIRNEFKFLLDQLRGSIIQIQIETHKLDFGHLMTAAQMLTEQYLELCNAPVAQILNEQHYNKIEHQLNDLKINYQKQNILVEDQQNRIQSLQRTLIEVKDQVIKLEKDVVKWKSRYEILKHEHDVGYHQDAFRSKHPQESHTEKPKSSEWKIYRNYYYPCVYGQERSQQDPIIDDLKCPSERPPQNVLTPRIRINSVDDSQK